MQRGAAVSFHSRDSACEIAAAWCGSLFARLKVRTSSSTPFMGGGGYCSIQSDMISDRNMLPRSYLFWSLSRAAVIAAVISGIPYATISNQLGASCCRWRKVMNYTVHHNKCVNSAVHKRPVASVTLTTESQYIQSYVKLIATYLKWHHYITSIHHAPLKQWFMSGWGSIASTDWMSRPFCSTMTDTENQQSTLRSEMC